MEKEHFEYQCNLICSSPFSTCTALMRTTLSERKILHTQCIYNARSQLNSFSSDLSFVLATVRRLVFENWGLKIPSIAATRVLPLPRQSATLLTRRGSAKHRRSGIGTTIYSRVIGGGGGGGGPDNPPHVRGDARPSPGFAQSGPGHLSNTSKVYGRGGTERGGGGGHVL